VGVRAFLATTNLFAQRSPLSRTASATPRSENKNTIAEKTCKHGDYGPGADLCAYLIENTSTEFPDANLNAVMVCLGAARPSEIVYDLEYQSTNFWSHVAKGVHSEIIVGVDYSAGSESSAPSLKIMARKDQ